MICARPARLAAQLGTRDVVRTLMLRMIRLSSVRLPVDSNSGMWSTESARHVDVLPLDGMGLGGLVVLTDVAHEFAGHVGGRGEDAASDDVALDLAKPELDLIQPAGVGRSEVQTNVWMQAEELADPLGLVRREVVQDDVDLFLGRPAGSHRGKEGNELLTGVAGHRLAHDLAGPRIQRGIEREGAATDVLEAVAFSTTRRKRQHRQGPVEGLESRLLVDAEYNCVLGRIDIEGNHIGGLGLEVGVLGSDVALQAMGLEPGPRPDPSDSHVADAKDAAQLAGGPVGAAVAGRLLGQGQDSRLQALRRGARPTAAMPSVQALQPALQETRSPQADGGLAATKLVCYCTVGNTLGQEQDQTRSSGIRNARGSGTPTSRQLLSFLIAELDWLRAVVHAAIVSHYAPEMSVTIHL